MFDTIRQHEILSSIECYACCENNASVEFDKALLLNDDYLNYDKILVLKPDNYYHSSKMHNPPPSPDCLILICTEKEKKQLYLIELKDVKDTTELKYEIIVEKFKTMINQFFPEFETIFNTTTCKPIAFYLVTTYPKGSSQLSEKDYRSRIAGSALDFYGSRKPLKLFNKAIYIQPKASPFLLTACID
jgi:hypothetical protein